MNSVVLVGRLVREPEGKATQSGTFVTRYTLAIDRRLKREGEPSADFINCVAFGKGAEFAEKYFHKGMRVAVNGRIQTGSYTNKEGQKIHTTDIVVDNQEFADEKRQASDAPRPDAPDNGFYAIPDDVDDLFG